MAAQVADPVGVISIVFGNTWQDARMIHLVNESTIFIRKGLFLAGDWGYHSLAHRWEDSHMLYVDPNSTK
jgi:hypothetical protein